jgi:glycosyltransferase involved in cell wall biosynthesis
MAMTTTRSDRMVEFWSTVEYPILLGELADELGRRGYRATHRYYYSSEQYRMAKSRWQRLKLRLDLYIGYPLLLIWHILFRVERGAKVVVTSNTFYAPWVARMVSRWRKVSVIHLLYDTYPDALIESGNLSSDSWVAKAIAWVTSQTLKRCHGNAFIGERLRQYAERQYGKARNGSVIPLAVACPEKGNLAIVSDPEQERITVLYCGNFGHLHDVETFPEALRGLGLEVLSRLHIRFHTSGGRREEGYRLLEEVQRQHPELKMTLGDSLGFREWEDVMRGAAVGLVTMRTGAEKVLFPSKTFSAMAMGQAILAICSNQSDLADLVKSSEGGWQGEPGDVQSVQNALREIVSDPQQLLIKRTRASEYVPAHYSMQKIADQWIDYLNSID